MDGSVDMLLYISGYISARNVARSGAEGAEENFKV